MPTIKNNISKAGKHSQRAGLRWLLIIGILFCELLSHTWIRTANTQAMIRITQAEKQILKDTSYQRALLLEIDRLKSEDRIRRIAQSRLNLIIDTGKNTRYLSKESDNG